MKIILVRDQQKILHLLYYIDIVLRLNFLWKMPRICVFSLLSLKRIFSIVKESLEVTIFIKSPQISWELSPKKHYQSHSIKTSWSLEDITIISLYPSMYIVKSYHLIQVKVFCSQFPSIQQLKKFQPGNLEDLKVE